MRQQTHEPPSRLRSCRRATTGFFGFFVGDQVFTPATVGVLNRSQPANGGAYEILLHQQVVFGKISQTTQCIACPVYVIRPPSAVPCTRWFLRFCEICYCAFRRGSHASFQNPASCYKNYPSTARKLPERAL